MYMKLQPSTPPLCLFSLLLFMCSTLSYQQVYNHLDQSALLTFYGSIQTSSPPLNWSASITCCHWEGVACDINGRVTHLQLSSRGIQGVITSSLSNLTSLTHLNLSNNLLSGPLPNTFFGLMDSLEVIDLSSNHLYGNFSSSLSSRGSFPMKIHTIDISSNQFEGNIGYSWFLEMKGLTIFNSSNNGFIGSIPSFVCLSSPLLKTLDLSHNHFTGPIQEEIGECSQLEVFQVGFNSLSGPLKGGIVRLTNLKIIDFSSNDIFGLIPHKIGNLFKLEKLYLNNNNMSGPIPPSLMNCTNLMEVILRVNSFNGEISKLDWSRLVKIQKLDLGFNSFNGPLPESIYSCKSLVAFRVTSNNFSGGISPKVVELKSLSFLSITENSFTNITKMLTVLLGCQNLSVLLLGSNFQGEALPRSRSFLAPTVFPNLRYFSLALCNLTGFFPEWISHLKTLQYLRLSYNQITDKIPSWIGTLPNLSRLVLDHNNLFGEVPKELCQLPAILVNMDPKLSQIQSELPVYVNNHPTQYTQFSFYSIEIDLGSNKFSGDIPFEIGNLQGLQLLYLGNNQFTGHIPLGMANLRNLIQVDLSQNNLSGEIPTTLAELHFLNSFNVADNDLQGPIPTGGQFSTFDKSSFEGNPRLCGQLLHRPCSEMAPPSAKVLPDHDGESDGTHWFLNGLFVGFASGFSSVLVIVASYLWFNR